MTYDIFLLVDKLSEFCIQVFNISVNHTLLNYKSQ